MTQKKLWIIAAFPLLAELIVNYKFKIELVPADFKMAKFSLDLFSEINMVLFFAAVLGALSALIPFRKKLFGDKFKILFPIFVIIVSSLFAVSLGYGIYLKKAKGIDMAVLRLYESIEVSKKLDCSSVYEGKFETETLWIERNGNRQIQTNKKSGVVKEYKVEWNNNCEYSLTGIADGKEKLKVKIVGVTEEGYNCWFVSDRSPMGFADFLKIKRVK